MLQAPFSGNYCGRYFLKPRNLRKRKAWDSGKRGIQNKRDDSEKKLQDKSYVACIEKKGQYWNREIQLLPTVPLNGRHPVEILAILQGYEDKSWKSVLSR